MADNLTTQSATPATVPASSVIATDDVAGVHFQKMKLALGADGAEDLVVDSGQQTMANSVPVAIASNQTAVPAAGDVAHDTGDSGNPVKVGGVAIAHGANPTAVTAADRTNLYANRAGIPFVIGGHMNVVAAVYNTTGAQTDDNIMAAIASGTKYVVTSLQVFLDEACTVGVTVRIGFGTANVPALGASGADAVAGIVAYHPGVVPGGGFVVGDGSGIIGIGGDGEELRITCDAPTGGSLAVCVKYFTIES